MGKGRRDKKLNCLIRRGRPGITWSKMLMISPYSLVSKSLRYVLQPEIEMEVSLPPGYVMHDDVTITSVIVTCRFNEF